MTGPGDTYRSRAVVLTRTKLAETDLIVGMLAEDGMLLRAVAKGARKPKSPFAARLEIGKRVDVLCAKGRSLDIVKECALLPGNALELGLERTAAFAPVAELASKLAQEDLESPRLFPCVVASVEAIERSDPRSATALCAASLLKVLSFAGLRPALSFCARCGAEIRPSGAALRASYVEGGCLCAPCGRHGATEPIGDDVRQWAHALLHSTFAQIAAWDVPSSASRGTLRLCQGIVEAHIGSRLRSLSFLLDVIDA